MNFLYKIGNIFMSIFLFMLMIFFAMSCKNENATQNFPFYKQTSEKTCGPTCLRMIFKYYGQTYTESYLSKITHFDSSKGTSMYDLFSAAESLGFKPEGVEVDFQNLSKNVVLPCIAYCKPHHFVVVYKIEDSKVYVADPADSLRIYNKEEFCNFWEDPNSNGIKTGYALIINKKQ
ncbi:cysteine peptidase family C39 domain-containing protein [Chryseobacterium sp. Y16C]|uniref:cysteine peptidase family C39 domain-containing protein n=1 Tax=Chryseobacterium sp. Y16C TaxID=2920939 RepID=UPI001F0B33EC|nr:cysteine peptidase family C39 domain-containing protein [Chryseobacterium sp. Y16C]UMQ40379.1 cysteine peptidase family C39 domain-containing protein [Chryseobacterium sp. Y16C]